MAKESSAGISEQLKDLLAQSENQMKAIRDQIAEQWDAKRKAVTDLVDQQWDAQKKAVADLLEQQRKLRRRRSRKCRMQSAGWADLSPHSGLYT